MFFLRVRIDSASAAYDGASTTSVNTSATCAAISSPTSWFVAITPPNALTGSVAWASRWAAATSAPTAIPHGLVCLMIATVGRSPWSCAARHAASAST